MIRRNNFLFLVLVAFSTACTVYSQCTEIKAQSGILSHSFYYFRYSTRQQCWTVPVPENRFIKLDQFSWSMYSQSCSYAYLKIHVNDTNETYTFCGTDSYSKLNPITALTDVQIEFYFQEYNGNSRSPSFRLQYDIRDIECVKKGSFKCSSHSCIPKSKVCDGIEDCKNGIDEIGCDTGILSVVGVDKARAQAISWLKSKRTPFWDWHENTPRAVTALFLSNGAYFNGSNLDEELMAKQSEVKIAISLLKSPISYELLSTFINSLLVTCHSPRHFYGQNLVKRLKEQVDSSLNLTHPIVYLSLCNANESWPQRAPKDLLKILNSSSEYHFVKDIQSYAVMAVACYTNNSFIINKINTTTLVSQVKITLDKFKKGQLPDGSFGNVQTTSLVTQALISSGLGHARDWNLNATVKYLIKELNSTDVDFPTVYLTLPVFNGKSLTHIFKVNCTGNPRKRITGNLKSEIDEYVGPKIRVQFSLFIGDEKDIIHTLFLRVPKNYTAYQVMRYAEEEDIKYKFEWKRILNKMYVYKIGKIINDPDVGKFWLAYLGSIKSTVYKQTTLSNYFF
ncbi:uncharacterized protein CG3556-like isoform X2 [Parasteatoda tepidariorum]|uniref:uncharacterized protein CG3556-like isoform X1 n=1 Tax=Parasteatoda tepidariorum TaxID=114398 RepID=UPI0039BC6290